VARILVVEDDALSREVMARMCASAGEVVEAHNGGAAWTALRTSSFDLVLLDLHMPEMDGFAVLEKLRETPVSPRPAVIIVTAGTDVHGRVRAAELGALDFVEKPFRIGDLERRVRRALAVVELEQRVTEAEAALKSLRATDEKTGAGSFQKLYETLQAEFRCAEVSVRPLVCVLAADERYADILAYAGREAGDERLRHLALAIEAVLFPTDHFFRIDAAEFVVLRPRCTEEQAFAFVRQLQAAVARGGRVIAQDLAIATASFPHPEITQASTLYRAANTALAQARSRGPGSVVYFQGF